MGNIRVGRYQAPPSQVDGWVGWIEPEDMSWIMFVRADGSVKVYLNRDASGGIIED